MKKTLEYFHKKDHWKVVGGIVLLSIAYLVPVMLLGWALSFVLEPLPLSNNIKNSILTILVFSASLALVYGGIKLYGKNFKDLGVGKIKPEYFFRALAYYGLYFVVSLVLQFVATTFFNMNSDQEQYVGYTSPNGIELILAFISLVVITPFTEEVMFRGVLFSGFRKQMSFAAAAILSSAIFGLMHGQWNVGLDVFVMGVVSCYLLETTKSLWPSIFLHAIKNCLAFCLLYLYNGI